jgi:hypothetical protein
MNGVHDMGGLQGYGPVMIEANEPLFHGEWERRALGVTVAMGASGLWNIDLARSARESLPPLDYLQGPYYAIWIQALQKLLVERGLITLERGQYEWRFIDIVDPDTLKPLYRLEHEVRSVTNPLYARPLINRNPDQTNISYVPGYDATKPELEC